MLKTILAFATVLSACTDAAPSRVVEAFPAPGAPSRTSPTGRTLDTPPGPAEVTVLANHERGATLLDHESESTIELSDSPCECTSRECVSRWIEDNIGCNIAVDLVCPGGSRGGLVRCTESDPQPTAGALHE